MRVLVAEDDRVTREALEEILSGEGHEVLAARNGEEALRLWKLQRPELVLLDIMMPGASGYDVCRGIREDDARVPVVFLSAKSEEMDVVLGLELGADDFLRKPFGKHELLARVRAVLRRRGAGSREAATVMLGSWTLRPRELRAVHADGRGVELTSREVKILVLLAERAGEVVTRDELLNRCWGMDYFPESRTLDQHMLNLRKKLEDDPSRPGLIATVRGAGYRFPGAAG